MPRATLYAAVAVGGFRRYSSYRAATLAGIFTNTVFGVILAYGVPCRECRWLVPSRPLVHSCWFASLSPGQVGRANCC